MSNINPASPLVLTHDEHALLGELVEIMGLIENMLIQSVEQVGPAVSEELRKRTAGPQAKLWADTVIGRISDPTMSTLVPSTKLELEKLAEDRNDFVHALYEGDYVAAGVFEPGIQTTSAIRSKTGNSRPTAELQSIRDRAATLSVVVAQIVQAIV